MRDQRYLLVIMNDRGRPLRRKTVSRRVILAGLGLLSIFLACVLTLSIHAYDRRQVALQAERIADENQELVQLNAAIEKRMPAARQMEQRAQLTFSQLWAKSGLSPEPNALGVGPVEGDESEILPAAGDDQYMHDIDVLDVPLELDRMLLDGPTLQSELGVLLEYFHDADRLLSNTPSIKPAHTPWLTSGFGRRHDPMTGQLLMHKGIDLGGQIGDPVYAPADGVVILAARRGGYGMTVVIDHGFGIQTHFAHLSRFRVQVGDRIKRGQLIADMGTTGKSTGPHLHYEVRRMGHPLDPINFIMD